MAKKKYTQTYNGLTAKEAAEKLGIQEVSIYERIRRGMTIKEAFTKAPQKLNTHAKGHGMTGQRLYRIWKAMRERCRNPKHKYWHGKGVKVCKEWEDFSLFYDWAIKNGYKDNLTIDRKNSNSHYCPSNCQWATMREQNRNHGNHITYKGELASDATKRLGGKGENLVAQRIRVLGWSKKKAFTTPVIKK